MKTRAFAILALFLSCGLRAQEVAFPTPDSLITRAVAAAKAQAERNWQYTYREDHTQTHLDKKGIPGTLETRTYDHIMLEGSQYKKLVLVDGRPLDPKTQKKVDADLEKARAERRRAPHLSRHFSVSLGTLELVLKLFDNKVTAREIVNGRTAWKMESEPKPGIKPANKQEEEMLASRRTNWFDEQDGHRVRELIEFQHSASAFQPGTIFDLQFALHGEEWLVNDMRMHASLKAAFIRDRLESHQHYYDYKRFEAESTFTPQ